MPCPTFYSFQCPGCKTQLGYALGDDLSGPEWTDGFGADLPPSVIIPVYQCTNCQEIHWAESSRLTTDMESLPPDTPTVKPPSASALLAALEKGLAADRPSEFIARLLAWWRMNDACRWNNQQSLPPPSAAAIRNMEWLREYVHQSRLPYDQELNSAGLVFASFEGKLFASLRHHNLIEVELLRNLGRFDQALQQLDELTKIKFVSERLTNELLSLVEFQRKLCAARDTRVRPTTEFATEQIDMLARFS